MKNEPRGWGDAPMTCYKRDNDNDFSKEHGEDFNGGDEEDDSVKGELPFNNIMHNDKLFLFFQLLPQLRYAILLNQSLKNGRR